MKTVLLKPISHTAITGELLCASSAMTARSAGLFSCGRITRIHAACRNGISRSFSGSTKGKVKAEQRQLNSQVPHCLAIARSIMRQKRRKAQPENTVHKDMIREEFARSFNPQVADRLRQILEQNKRAREGHE
ncbi:hypothetical protein J2067_004842 [Erwinia rhapontici]|nr:hypothetical protein [Erwinia rhapontici]